MSAVPHEHHDERDYDRSPEDDGDSKPAGAPVVVRRNAGVVALIGAAASAVAIAYLWRATDTGAVLDWALCLVMALIAGFYLSSLVDARTPLVVADDLGVRIRLGNQWRGLPWDAVREVVVQPRRGPLRDGRLVFSPHSLARALEGLEPRGRRQAALNQKMYGAALAVSLGVTTRVSQDGEQQLGDRLAGLAKDRAEVLVVEPEPAADQGQSASTAGAEAGPAPSPGAKVDAAPATSRREPDAAVRPTPSGAAVAGPQTAAREPRAEVDRPGSGSEPAPTPAHEPPGQPVQEPAAVPLRRLVGGIGTIVSRVAKGRGHDVDSEPGAGEPAGADAADAEAAGAAAAPAPSPAEASIPSVPLRQARPALRADVTRDTPAADAEPEHEGRVLTRPGSVELVIEPVPVHPRVRPIAQIGEAVEPLVIDDFATEPAYDPVIGPELAAARTRIGLTVDDLAERTRIRPHVIESIEVDDFAPCGGDFYARGHLRTLARMLGKDVTPLLEQFDARYATAPINARRVFEAELATGVTGSIRRTTGGPNWALLVGAVLVLALVWGLVRLFAAEPREVLQTPGVVLNGSAGVSRSFGGHGSQAAAEPMRVVLVTGDTATRVVVRDKHGKVVFARTMPADAHRSVKALPPVRVQATDAGDVHVLVRGKDRGAVGEDGRPGRRTFHRTAAR